MGWDKEYSTLINKRKLSYKKLISCPSRENLINYRNTSLLVRKKIQKKKRNNFRNFVSSLDISLKTQLNFVSSLDMSLKTQLNCKSGNRYLSSINLSSILFIIFSNFKIQEAKDL